MHTVLALLCFVMVIHWLIFQYPSGLHHWHCGNLTIAPVPAKQPWWIWMNTSCEFIMNDCITTTKQSTTKPCAYFLGYTVCNCSNADTEFAWCMVGEEYTDYINYMICFARCGFTFLSWWPYDMETLSALQVCCYAILGWSKIYCLPTKREKVLTCVWHITIYRYNTYSWRAYAVLYRHIQNIPYSATFQAGGMCINVHHHIVRNCHLRL